MLGEVVDEDELRSGERREGIYFGLFTFLRKLGGALGVALALLALEFAGYENQPEQNEATLAAIRTLTAAVPAAFVFLAGLAALGYPLTRERHDQILQELSSGGPVAFEDDSPVRPDGMEIRRRRRAQGWSRREFVVVMAAARERESGLRETISVNLLEGMEESSETVPYETLCRVASGLDCNPIELLREESA